MSSPSSAKPGRPAKPRLTRAAPCLSAAAGFAAGAFLVAGQSAGAMWALLLFASASLSAAVASRAASRSGAREP